MRLGFWVILHRLLVKLIKLKRTQTVCTEKERKRDVGWWSNFILSSHKTGGGFQRGSTRHVTVTSFRGPTRQVGHLQVQGRDTSRRCHLTGARHTTTFPTTRVQCPLCDYSSSCFWIHRFNPLFLFRRWVFFLPFRLPSSSLHTLWHISARGLRA
jgi:hypothetical protein